MQLGRALALDPATGRPSDDPEATRLLARPYRGPWAHPAHAQGEWRPWEAAGGKP